MPKDQCDYNAMSGKRCRLPPLHWRFNGSKRIPRKVCFSHIHSEVDGGVSKDAPDRTEEYESLGYVRIEVDEERGYTMLLQMLIDMEGGDTNDEYGYAPRYVWIRVER